MAGSCVIAALAALALLIWPSMTSKAQTATTTQELVVPNPYTNQPGSIISSRGSAELIYLGNTIHEYRIWCTAGQLVITSELSSSTITLSLGQSIDINGKTVGIANGSSGTGQYIRID